ncbi:MAG: cell division protein CrgA [Actinomycetota bacterium]|nr:cell division protein CrgA [Actinomycetota bacterium]
MPKSKSKRSRYQPPPKKKPKPSPRWFGILVLAILGLGVLTIVLNYLALIPWEPQARNLYLWSGLGAIAVGFGLATQWR